MSVLVGGWIWCVSLATLGSSAAPEDAAIEGLFERYVKNRDAKAGEEIAALNERAVPFLAGVIKAQEPHAREIFTVKGKEILQGTWSQEASTLLVRIGGPEAVSVAKDLGTNKNAEIRFWGIWILSQVKTEESASFLRERAKHETGRNLGDIVEFLGEWRDPADVPFFRRQLASERDSHVRLALCYAIALSGDLGAVAPIIEACERGSGHLGVVYLQRISGKSFGWDAAKWRQWLAEETAQRGRANAPRTPPQSFQGFCATLDSLGFPDVRNLTWAVYCEEPSVRIVDEERPDAEDRVSPLDLYYGWILKDDGKAIELLTAGLIRERRAYTKIGGSFAYDGLLSGIEWGECRRTDFLAYARRRREVGPGKEGGFSMIERFLGGRFRVGDAGEFAVLAHWSRCRMPAGFRGDDGREHLRAYVDPGDDGAGREGEGGESPGTAMVARQPCQGRAHDGLTCTIVARDRTVVGATRARDSMRTTAIDLRIVAAWAAGVLALPAAAAMGAAGAPPPNAPAACAWDESAARLRLAYHDGVILDARVLVKAAGGERAPSEGEVTMTPAVAEGEKVEQRVKLAFAREAAGAELVVCGIVTGSEEAFPAETRTDAQRRFAYVRNSAGLSANARNNAVYDRRWDWVIVGPGDGRTRIEPRALKPGSIDFAWESRGAEVEILFKPRFYQQHKHLAYFEPWTYRVRRDSITGWCSWWAYRADFTQKDLEEVVGIMAEKRLADFGYRFIQIDDAYQGGSGTPKSWLEWNGKFPGGIAGYARAVREKGFEPAIWIGVFFRDGAIAAAHPEWFVRKADGKPFKGPWIEYGMDATVPEVAGTLIRPTYRGFREHGFTYVKIDTLRHLLYDSLHVAPEYGRDRGLHGDAIFRRYLALAREELGPGTFILACWGVLPEAIGFADGCRLGGDGFGPCTMQQYNSWNGIVWRNDPDHCDVVTESDSGHTTRVVAGDRNLACPNESLLRPALASFAGAMLMLSDRAGVYARDENLEGARRASPVLFTVPGQLYDFDPAKSDKVIALARADVVSGGPPSPIDADQRGAICPWWMLEIERPFERWSVLARMNWGGAPMAETRVAFADLGLPDREYLVYEFWSRTFLGVCREEFGAAAVPPFGIHVYALRAKLDRPQIVATSRHMSQGAVDLERVEWRSDARTLSGRSRVIRGDPYEIAIYLPPPFAFASVRVDGEAVNGVVDGPLLRVTYTPRATKTVAWDVQCK